MRNDDRNGIPKLPLFADLTRRDLLRLGAMGGAGMALGDLWFLPAFAAPPKPTAKAKSVIQIWMWGGPSHLDTFDPKPEAGSDYSGPLDHPIETNVSGIRICELMPNLAKCADKYSIIRGMTHGVNGHETASYEVQTGRAAGGKDVYPCVGAVVSYFKGSQRRLQGIDSALHRPHRAAGTLFGRGISRPALPALRHRRRSGADALCRRRRGAARRQ
jgi:hypothetical protein